ncbi:MAG: glycosyltransferase [Chloroflexi bacterium]|nr:glycosyltransferase [Chloroflexota bacterium]MCA2001806.1 glycosyltransferase [Chloroflexota bacterium]
MLYLVVSTLLFLAAIVIVYWIHNQRQLDIVVAPAPPPAHAPLISICIPARNEEKNIRACVEAALGQDYPNIEVIVLDDRSTDSTPTQLAELASRDSRLLPIFGKELPAGWAGKPHALFQASAAAHGEWLCFLDADTFLAPNAISACYAKALEIQADLLTAMNEQILGSFWEKVIMPLVMTALSVGFSPRKVNDPARRDAVANGQFILIRRAVYDAVGGHEKVKDQIVEDKAIAEQVKWNGYRLAIADGRNFIRTRMYTDLPSMWEGWTKNIYLGLSGHPFLLLLGAFGALLALMAALFLPLWTLLGLGWLVNDGGWMAAIVSLEALLVWGWLIYFRAKAARDMNISAWYALTTPLGAGVFAAMMLTSAWKVISGQGVTWRGRKYHSK